MKYLVFAFLAALIMGVIRLWFVARSQRMRPLQLVVTSQEIVPKTNHFISAGAIQSHQLYRDHAEVAVVPTTSQAALPSERRTRADIQAEARSRDDMKAACIAVLDEAALEHPAGHTGSVGRYVLRSKVGDRIEILFEKRGKGRSKLWIAQQHAGALLDAGMELRTYPASDIYKSSEDGGHLSYGRHSALKSMRGLANADLVRFTINQVEQVEVILAKLAVAV